MSLDADGEDHETGDGQAWCSSSHGDNPEREQRGA
jgi:hypothetical protein